MEKQLLLKDRLKSHAALLTDKHMEGRLSGTRGAKIAATYLSNTLQEIGYLPHPAYGDFHIPIKVFASRLFATPLLKVGNRTFQHRIEFAEYNWVSSGGKVIGPLLIIKDGVPVDESRLKESVVLIPEAPKDFDVVSTVQTAVVHGVEGLLIESGEPKWFYKTVFGSKDPKLPVLRVKRSIAKELSQFGGETVSIELPLENSTLPCQNVIGFLSGVDSSETIVLSAHYDHLGNDPSGHCFPGAIDNASGVVTILETARVLADRGKLPFNLVVAFFSGEESGLIGAYQFIDSFPDKITAAINIDCVGQEYPVSLARIGYKAPDHWLPRAAKRVFESLGTDIKWKEYGGEDSVAFRKNGIPALGLGQKPLSQSVSIHTPTDNFSALNFESLEKWVDLTINLVNELAIHKPYLKGGERK